MATAMAHSSTPVIRVGSQESWEALHNCPPSPWGSSSSLLRKVVTWPLLCTPGSWDTVDLRLFCCQLGGPPWVLRLDRLLPPCVGSLSASTSGVGLFSVQQDLPVLVESPGDLLLITSLQRRVTDSS